MHAFFALAVLNGLTTGAVAAIDRRSIVSQFNPIRHASSNSTPLQVGNGNFAFGADITGLQTFLPYNILSSWCWHNSSLPTTPGQTEPEDFTGLDWWTHGRLVNYDQPNPAEAAISQWMIGNPHRVNLGRIGLAFLSQRVAEEDLDQAVQILDQYEGVIRSNFSLNGTTISVQTSASPNTDTIAVEITSDLIRTGKLGVFFDYPYMTDKNKFEAPFVGLWNATSNHSTSLQQLPGNAASIRHDLDATTYYTTVTWESRASLTGPLLGTHRYILQPARGGDSTLSFTATFVPASPGHHRRRDVASKDVQSSSAQWWQSYWTNGAFVDLVTGNPSNSNATELQRRTVQSQYLLAVNGAGHDPPQESGLTNNGWYGKFHAEQFYWHLQHWTAWNHWDLFGRTLPGVYERFLPTSFQRAQEQGYAGARWGKMSDPTGRSAPGEINSLLIWQQPHPMIFAETQYKAFPDNATLGKWDAIITATADFMTSFAFYNASTGVYDLGPPMYPVSENTNPNATTNPTFELAYWRFGLNVASVWKARQNQSVPSAWTKVLQGLAPLPVVNGSYVLYEGVPDPWTDPELTEDHPALLGINGWLPPDPTIYNATVFGKTVENVYSTWNFTYGYGWDFPLLAMTSIRTGDPQQAVDWLLDPGFQFDDAGYAVGGVRVTTPYFPSASSMLLAVAMMAAGWQGSEGAKWPDGWVVESEGFRPGL